MKEKLVDIVTIKLQISLNNHMYSMGEITYDMYSYADSVLKSQLTAISKYDMIACSEM